MTGLTKVRMTMTMSALLAGLLAACGGGDGDTWTTGSTSRHGQPAVQPGDFPASALTSAITTVDCTLSGGAVTTCYRITTAGKPSEQAVRKLCRVGSGAASGAGVRTERGATHAPTDAFVADLATAYNNRHWELFSSMAGVVEATDTQPACEAVLRASAPTPHDDTNARGARRPNRAAEARGPI